MSSNERIVKKNLVLEGWGSLKLIAPDNEVFNIERRIVKDVVFSIGPDTSDPVDIIFEKVGRAVTLFVPNLTITTTVSGPMLSPADIVPEDFRPSSTRYSSDSNINIDLLNLKGVCVINSSGLFFFQPQIVTTFGGVNYIRTNGSTSNVFPAGADCDLNGVQCIDYCL